MFFLEHRLRCFIHRLISPMHQTCTRLLLNSSVDLLRVIKLRCWKLNLIKKNCQQKDTPLILKQMSRRMIDSPRCCFIPFIGWKFDASMHTSVRCIGEINRWIKQRSHCMQSCMLSYIVLGIHSNVSKMLGPTRQYIICYRHRCRRSTCHFRQLISAANYLMTSRFDVIARLVSCTDYITFLGYNNLGQPFWRLPTYLQFIEHSCLVAQHSKRLACWAKRLSKQAICRLLFETVKSPDVAPAEKPLTCTTVMMPTTNIKHCSFFIVTIKLLTV